MSYGIKKLLLGALTVLIIGTVSGGVFACSNNSATKAKASSALLVQVGLRQEQLANPTAERLAQMQSLGMNVANVGVQRTYIHTNQPLTPGQVSELQALGITLYLDSWIPPVGAHPTGFTLADVPVDKLDALAAKDYVVRLDTAEVKLEPQPAQPQGA